MANPPVSMRLFNPQPIRFGWDNKDNRPNPKKYAITLDLTDFGKGGLRTQRQLDAIDNPQPSLELIERVAKNLDRRGRTNISGFAVLTNPKSLLGSWPRVKQFQKELVTGLKKYMAREKSYLLKPQANLDEPKYEGYPWAPRVSIIPIRGYGENTKAVYDGWKSVKRPHFDDQAFNYVSLAYGPRANVKGGEPVLLDVKQFCKDKKREFEDVVELYAPAKDVEGARIKTKYTKEAIENYAYTIPEADPKEHSIVIFSNRRYEDGILHGATVVNRTIKAEEEETKRVFRSLNHVGIVTYG